MNQFEQTYSSLSDDERLYYLQLMQVPVWVRREVSNASDNLPVEIMENAASLPVEHTGTCFGQESAEKTAVQDSLPQNESESVEKNLERNQKSDQPSSQAAQSIPVNQFLKLVSWSSNATKALDSSSPTVARKKVLFICRHQKDQPAQSFAGANSPSQFMRDYLAAVELLTPGDNFDLESSLAHLTEAGLSQACRPLSESLTELKPDIIVLLGDESVRHLLGSDLTVAESRTRCHSYQGCQLIVSYHPFTLIENPQLKKLALEDIRLLISLMSAQLG